MRRKTTRHEKEKKALKKSQREKETPAVRRRRFLNQQSNTVHGTEQVGSIERLDQGGTTGGLQSRMKGTPQQSTKKNPVSNQGGFSEKGSAGGSFRKKEEALGVPKSVAKKKAHPFTLGGEIQTFLLRRRKRVNVCRGRGGVKDGSTQRGKHEKDIRKMQRL